MKPLVSLLIAGMMAAGLAAAEDASHHPPIRLLDAAGTNVLESGRPVSPMRTCAGCHDTAYIESHSFHAALGHDERTAAGFVEGGRLAWAMPDCRSNAPRSPPAETSTPMPLCSIPKRGSPGSGIGAPRAPWK